MPPVTRPAAGAGAENDDEGSQGFDDTLDAGPDDSAGAEGEPEAEHDDLAGGEDDPDGEDASGDAGEQAEVDEPPRSQRGPRENAAIRDLRAETQRLRQELEDEKRQRAVAPGPTAAEIAEQQRQERERVALMSDQERTEYYRSQDRNWFSSQIQQIRFEGAQSHDRARFDALKASDSFARKFSTQVEDMVAAEARQGRFLSREVALDYIVGKSMRGRTKAALPKQKARAEQRIERERGNGGDARGDRAPNRGRQQNEKEARKARLANQQL